MVYYLLETHKEHTLFYLSLWNCCVLTWHFAATRENNLKIKAIEYEALEHYVDEMPNYKLNNINILELLVCDRIVIVQTTFICTFCSMATYRWILPTEISHRCTQLCLCTRVYSPHTIPYIFFFLYRFVLYPSSCFLTTLKLSGRNINQNIIMKNMSF